MLPRPFYLFFLQINEDRRPHTKVVPMQQTEKIVKAFQKNMYNKLEDVDYNDLSPNAKLSGKNIGRLKKKKKSTKVDSLLLLFMWTGPVFMYSTGSIQALCIPDADMVKEVGLCTSLNLSKPSYLSKDPLMGLGIYL